MKKNTEIVAQSYYTGMASNNMHMVAGSLHPEVQIKTPLFQLAGKDAVLNSVKNLAGILEGVTVHALIGSDNQAMIAYDLEFPAPIGKAPAAALMTFKDGLIENIQLFYDARPFAKTVETITAQSK